MTTALAPLVLSILVPQPHAGPRDLVDWILRKVRPTPTAKPSCGRPSPEEFTCGGSLLKGKDATKTKTVDLRSR